MSPYYPCGGWFHEYPSGPLAVDARWLRALYFQGTGTFHPYLISWQGAVVNGVPGTYPVTARIQGDSVSWLYYPYNTRWRHTSRRHAWVGDQVKALVCVGNIGHLEQPSDMQLEFRLSADQYVSTSDTLATPTWTYPAGMIGSTVDRCDELHFYVPSVPDGWYYVAVWFGRPQGYGSDYPTKTVLNRRIHVGTS